MSTFFRKAEKYYYTLFKKKKIVFKQEIIVRKPGSVNVHFHQNGKDFVWNKDGT